MKLTTNKRSVAHKPGEYDEVSAVKILVQSSKSEKRISEIAKLTIDLDNNMLICDACSTYASVRLRCVAGLPYLPVYKSTFFDQIYTLKIRPRLIHRV